MTVLRTIGLGLKTTNQKFRLAVYLWLANFAFSLILTAPVYCLLSRDFSRSLMADQLAGGIDLIWLGDLFYKYRDIFPAFVGWFLVPGILFLLLHIFLNGGVIGRIVAGEEKATAAAFFSDCGHYFFRLFRIFLLSLVGYIVLLGGVFLGIKALLEFWEKNAASEWTLIITSNLRFLLLILLFSIVRMFFDYVKIRLVREDSKEAVKAALRNFSFLRRRFFRAWLLYLLVGLVMALLGVVYLSVYQPMPKTGFMLFLAFFWQQLYVLSKMWTKILFFSTEYHFLQLQEKRDNELSPSQD